MLALKPTISNRWWPQQKVELYLILFWTILQFSFSFMNKSIIKFNYNNKFINSRHNTPIQTKQFNILSVSPQKKNRQSTHPQGDSSWQKQFLRPDVRSTSVRQRSELRIFTATRRPNPHLTGIQPTSTGHTLMLSNMASHQNSLWTVTNNTQLTSVFLLSKGLGNTFRTTEICSPKQSSAALKYHHTTYLSL